MLMIACGDDKKQTVEDVIATSNAEINKEKRVSFSGRTTSFLLGITIKSLDEALSKIIDYYQKKVPF